MERGLRGRVMPGAEERMTMAFEALHALLLAFGYEVRFHEHEWTECLLLRDGETWHGRGTSRSKALECAVNLACPSALAQQLLSKAVQAPGQMSGEMPGQMLGVMPGEVSRVTPKDEVRNIRPEASLLHGEVQAPVQSSVQSPIQSPVQSPIQSPEPKPRVPSSGSSNGRLRYPVRSEPPPLVRRDSAPPRADLARSLEELEILMDRIRDAREELGLCAPERQRLAILAWICEARAHTDTFAENPRVRDEVAAVSRQLTEIGKSFWPGSVTALQLQMQPRDLPRHLLGGSASTWARAAELAERALQSQEYADERRGFDIYGWADTALTRPRPESPEDVLEKLVDEVEAFGGGLDRQAEPRDPDARPEPEVFVRWVRQLRWLRGASLKDPELWARAAGRLRWWSNRRDPQLLAATRELDASYLPKSAWAYESGCSMYAHKIEAGRRPLPELNEKVQGVVRGRRVVMVSHRRDPDLQAEIGQALEGASMHWCVAEPRRLQELGEEISRKNYDLVLGAIGLQSPAADQLLARACRDTGTTFLRVNRGRTITCLRTLARSLI